MPGGIARVCVLLPHWLKHNDNAEHAREFRQWARWVRDLGAGQHNGSGRGCGQGQRTPESSVSGHGLKGMQSRTDGRRLNVL